MTYQEYFEKLQKDFAEKSDALIKADKTLRDEPNGFIDRSALGNFLNADAAFKVSGNNYHNLLTFVRDNNIQPNDEIEGQFLKEN